MWLRGDTEGPAAHVHEGVQLADRSGWVAIGELLPGEGQTPESFKVIIRAVDNEAATKWTTTLGDLNTDTTKSAYSVGFSLIEVSRVEKSSDLYHNDLSRAVAPYTPGLVSGRRPPTCRPRPWWPWTPPRGPSSGPRSLVLARQDTAG